MLKLLRRLALGGVASAVAATSLVGLTAPAQADVWTVTLTATPATTVVGTSSTLTATTNQDVGPTPYYTEIFDNSTGVVVAICGSGTTCSGTVTQSTATTHGYIAFVSNYDTNFPPSGIQATSNTATVTWIGPPPPPSVGGPAGASSLCDGGTQIVDQTSEGVHTKLYTLVPAPSQLDVCVRVEENGFGLGGEFTIQEPSPSGGITNLGVPTTDSNFTACQTTPGNTVPGAHPIEQGTVAGVSVLFDAYANASTAWVCLYSPAAQTRLVVPIPQVSVTIGPLPSVSFVPDPGTP